MARLGLLLTLVSVAPACGDASGQPTAGAVGASDRAECSPRLDPKLPAAAQVQAHALARELGRQRGGRDAGDHIALRTVDGYRLRRITSTALMVLGLFLIGALAAGLLLGLLGRHPALRYARRLDDAIDQQIAALRAFATNSQGSAERLFARLEDPLLAAERRSERLLDLATALEEQRDSDLARDRLEELYGKLEALADAVERLHLRATGWRDRLAEAVDEAAEAEAEAHVSAFAARVEELA